MRQPFEINSVGMLFDQQRFSAPRAAANQHHRFLHQLVGRLNRRLAQRFVAASDQRIINSGLFHPRLRNVRALAAACAAKIAVRIRQTDFAPGVNTLFADFTLHQTMAECERGFRSLTFITGANGGAFKVVHQREVECRGHRTLRKFDGRAHVN
ncbi:hypothetical protein D3C78_1336810 [compost metagenome]